MKKYHLPKLTAKVYSDARTELKAPIVSDAVRKDYFIIEEKNEYAGKFISELEESVFRVVEDRIEGEDLSAVPEFFGNVYEKLVKSAVERSLTLVYHVIDRLYRLYNEDSGFPEISSAVFYERCSDMEANPIEEIRQYDTDLSDLIIYAGEVSEGDFTFEIRRLSRLEAPEGCFYAENIYEIIGHAIKEGVVGKCSLLVDLVNGQEIENREKQFT